MFSLLLAVIYMAFISLGLPDSLLGSAWPIMQVELGASLSFAGLITVIISCGSIISSLLSDRLIRRWGTGLVVAISVSMTAAALFGFSVSNAPWMLCLWSIPYGLGAGAVDATLNNYVALHYSSRQMSWLHAFWGVGVTISPYIMSLCLSMHWGWEWGYRWVCFLQVALSVGLFCSLPLWKRSSYAEDTSKSRALTIPQALRLPGAVCLLVAFFCYCAVETTAGLWASSYLVGARGVDAQTAASFAALFYIGITAGRILNGFIADKLGDRRMIRIGCLGMLLGIVMVLLPLRTNTLALCGLVVIGLGGAPIYPCIIHSTPANFGEENSQSLVGIQMACAYTGTSLISPLFGIVAEYLGISLYPVYLAVFAALMLVMTERMNRKIPL